MKLDSSEEKKLIELIKVKEKRYATRKKENEKSMPKSKIWIRQCFN